MTPEIHRQITRRHFFGRSARGIGTLALASLLDRSLFGSGLRPHASSGGVLPALHFAPRAKRIIYLFMSGAPSQLDLYDYKPKLIELNGKPMPESFTKGQRIAQLAGQKLTCVGTKFKFQKYGRSGNEVSEILPHIAGIADDIAIVRSMHTEAINHARRRRDSR